MVTGKELKIPLDHIRKELILTISANDPAILFEQADADEHGEALWQLIEGCEYEFEFSDETFSFEAASGIVRHSRNRMWYGMLRPGSYTGTLRLTIVQQQPDQLMCWPFHLEVRSRKLAYRSDYRLMLEQITEYCTDLLIQHSSPAFQNFEPDYEVSSAVLYQRFSFVKSIVASDEFAEAIHRIVLFPSTKWKSDTEKYNTAHVRRFGKKEIRQLAGNGKRIQTDLHAGLSNVPERINTGKQTETFDTHENRFVKYTLEQFLLFCADIERRVPQTQTGFEARQLIERLEEYLEHSLFRNISQPSNLKLNSPVLQRREGYREILRAWLMFDLAAKLIWKGGEDVYGGGKRDVAALYEYWIFFLLLDTVKHVFRIESTSLAELIEKTGDGLGLKLKQGVQTTVLGISDIGSRRLNVQFSYNRTFSKKAYPEGGTWSLSLRPDYTLSLWPQQLSAQEAEEQELIVHIHFDAKYKTKHLFDTPQTDQEIPENVAAGVIKNSSKTEDLQKMHVYRDAIRRTAGAYVIYPGNVTRREKGFRELLPGLGAFAVSPSQTETGIAAIESFIVAVRDHLMNRASEREHMAAHTFAVHQNDPEILASSLPEFDHMQQRLIPDATTVLVGYYKSQEHLNWCETTGFYNFRSGSGRDALQLTPQVVGARYLLLYSKEVFTSEVWEIVGHPQYWPKQDLIDKQYPGKPVQDAYLVLTIRRPVDRWFENLQWDVRQFSAAEESSRRRFPFHVTLTELLRKAEIKPPETD